MDDSFALFDKKIKMMSDSYCNSAQRVHRGHNKTVGIRQVQCSPIPACDTSEYISNNDIIYRYRDYFYNTNNLVP